jgi:hypothetical protein
VGRARRVLELPGPATFGVTTASVLEAWKGFASTDLDALNAPLRAAERTETLDAASAPLGLAAARSPRTTGARADSEQPHRAQLAGQRVVGTDSEIRESHLGKRS